MGSRVSISRSFTRRQPRSSKVKTLIILDRPKSSSRERVKTEEEMEEPMAKEKWIY